MSRFEDLVGMSLKEIKGEVGDDEIIFITDKNRIFKLHHYQDCCESVTVEDICGDINDLIGSPILVAEEVNNERDINPEGVTIPEYQDSFTWTFYKLDTSKGGVTIRWYGESNGYYSESVYFDEVN